jgi:hypothetical protein
MKDASVDRRSGTNDLPWVTVETFDDQRTAEWDAHVRLFSDAGFFHASPWMQVLQTSYGFRPVGLLFRRGTVVIGMIPFVEVSSRFTGRRGVSLPFSDECPPLALKGKSGSLLFPLIEFLRTQRWDFFEIRGSNDHLRAEVPSVSFYGHTVKFPENEEGLWKSFQGRARTAVRKSQALGVVVESGASLESLRQFHRLYCLTRQRHGLPPQPFSFFEAIHRHVLANGHGYVTLARAGGQCVAGAVFFHSGGRAIYKYAAHDTRFQSFCANNLVVWAGLQRARQIGCTSMDLGRTSMSNEGLRQFKQGWGSTEYRMDYAKYDLRLQQFVKEKDMAAGWYNWAFRRAPRWLSAAVGKVLYKHWA